MSQLFNATITTAATALGTAYQLRGTHARMVPASMTVQAALTYGSGGTSIDTYLQTSIDGTNWCDVMHFAQFTTANARHVGTVNSGKSVVPVAATDGALAASTVTDGLFGPLWRVKVVSVGTYAGGTILRIDAFGNGITLASSGY